MEVLTKKSRKREQKPDALKTARKVKVEDLRIGMKIVISWHKNLSLSKYIPKGLTEAQAAEWMFTAEGYDYVDRSKKIEQIDECPGKWRTHIHVNRSDCYDMRAFVWVVNE